MKIKKALSLGLIALMLMVVHVASLNAAKKDSGPDIRLSYSVKERPGTSVTWVYGKEQVNVRGTTSSGTVCTA